MQSAGETAVIRFITILLLVGLANFTGAICLAQPDVQFVPDQVLIKVQLGVQLNQSNGQVTSNDPQVSQLLVQLGATSVTALNPNDQGGTLLSRIYKITLAPGSDVLEAAQQLGQLEPMIYAHPNHIRKPFVLPSDSDFGLQWGLGPEKMNCPAAWDSHTGSRNIVIAIIDNGVDYDHPDLKGNIWRNPLEIADNGMDDDGNGYVDDVYGWDFVENDNDPRPGIHEVVIDIEDNITEMRTDEHGTHVAGIVGAVGNNIKGGQNITGVMWTCQIMVLRAGNYYWLSIFDIVAAIKYAADNGADVINMSFGGGGASIEALAIQYAASKGVTLVAAAGNSNWSWESYPAAYTNVISVAATDQNDGKASFSSYGNWVDISAPGTDILSTLPDDTYGFMDGTSMASPFVAGLAGLTISYARDMGWDFTNLAIESVLKDSADPIDQFNRNYVGQLGAGRINAEKALLLTADSRPLASLSITRIDNVSEDKLSQVNEYSSADLQAVAYYTDGSSQTVTNSVDWTVRPTRYARFDPQQPGHLLVYQVPVDREITITAMYAGWNTTASTHMLLTVKNINLTQEHSGLIISSADNMSQYDNLSVYEGQSIELVAMFVSPDNVSTNVTNASGMVWELISGKGFARLDAAIEATLWGLEVDQDQQVTIKGTYRNREAGLLFYDQIDVTVKDISPMAGLSIAGPQQITSGNSAQFDAKLVYTSNKEKDVTETVVWAVDATAASFMDSPRGKLKVENVTGTIHARISAAYTIGDDKSYTAYLDVTLLPATVAGETYQQEDQQPDPAKDQPPQGSIIPNIGCPAAAVAMFLIMGMSLALLTKPIKD